MRHLWTVPFFIVSSVRMDNHLFILKIEKQQGTYFRIAIESTSTAESCRLLFSWDERQLIFGYRNSLTEFLVQNEYQLRKILHNKRPDTFSVGFELRFIIRNHKDVEAFNNLSNTIVLDNTGLLTQSYARPIRVWCCPKFIPTAATSKKPNRLLWPLL